MEGTPLTTSTEPENRFYPKRPKHKRERVESHGSDDPVMLQHRRRIAREALKHEEFQTGPSDGSERRHRAPEAKQLHGEQHIGHVLINAEATKHHGEASLHSTPDRLRLPANKRIDTLSRSELLFLSEQIAVETSSLRNVYETHLIGEQALRRLVAEYLSGHDINEALQREILEHEIDFERDPALRDMTVPTDMITDDSSKVLAPGREALDQLLQKAQAGIAGNDDELSYDKVHPTYRMEHKGATRHQWRRTDIIMAIIIVLLLILVLAMYFGHH